MLENSDGGLYALGRQTVAAFLNAASGMNYLFTVQQVINMFNEVYPGGNSEALKDIFERENEKNCRLD